MQTSTNMASWSLLLVVLLIGCLETASAFKCYRCESNKNVTCSEKFDAVNSGLKPEPCDDIFEARFCIKTTGMHEGQIGTKRYCASRDQGNYCEYVRRPGDDREYRSCIYTCYSEGCNGASRHLFGTLSLLAILIIFSIHLELIH